MRNWTGENRHIEFFLARSVALQPCEKPDEYLSAFWRLYYNHHEGMYIKYAEEHLELCAKRLYFIPAGVAFQEGCTQPVEHFYIHFDLVGLATVATRSIFDSPLCVPSIPALEQAVDSLARMAINGKTLNLPVLCHLYSVIYQALATCLETMSYEQIEKCNRLSQEIELLLPALAFIEDNYSCLITNKQLAALCYLSESHFIRVFNASLGQSPSQYIIARRVRKAAQYLILSNASIEEIAVKTGFGNRYYFTRAFTYRMGVPPATYRKSDRKT